MKARASLRKKCLPGWWFISYLVLFLLFIVVVAVLISSSVGPLDAVWMIVVLSAAAIGVLHRLHALNTSAVTGPCAL